MRARPRPNGASGSSEGRSRRLAPLEGLGRRWSTPTAATVLPIPILIGLTLLAHFAFGPSVQYDPGLPILLGNTLGVTAVGLVIAYVALRNYRATGRVQVLLLGCGVLIFALGGVVAALVRSLPDGANLNVTIYNTGAVAGGTFHLVAAFLLLAGASPETSSAQRARWLLVGYAGSALFMLVLTVAALEGAVPTFFIQGVGPTPVRQAVLGAADLLFLFSSIVFVGSYLRTREAFQYWYACALALTCISLTAFFIEHSVGSPVGWVGRFSQYVGGVYFLLSLVSAARAAGRRGSSLDTVLARSLSGAEERFRALAENSPDAIHRFDPALNQIYVNAAGHRLHGRPAAAVVGGRLERTGVPPAQAAVLTDAVRKVFDNGESVQVEIDLPGSDGPRSFESRCVAERGPRGEVANVLMVTRDITDRKRAQDALRASEDKFARAFHGSTAAMAITRLRDGLFLDVNDRWVEINRFSRAEALGASSNRVNIWKRPEERDAFLRDLQRTGTVQNGEYRFLRKGGEEWTGLVSSHISVLEGEQVVISSINDITERKRVEEALREAEARYRELVRLAPAGIYEVDFRTRRFTSVNDAMVEILGYSREELLAMSPFEILDADSRARFQARLARWLAGEKPDADVEYRINARDGRTIDALLAVSFTVDDAGKPLGATVVGHDITERKRAEARIAADLEALTRMHALSGRMLQATGFEELLQEAMDTAVAIVHAQLGTLQLLEGDALRIVAHHGHERPFLDYFAAAESVASVCGEATRQGERVLVPDIEASPLFVGTPSLAVLRAAGVRAVQSTPMHTRAGRLLGILTTHWTSPHTPDEHDLWRLDLLARQVADLIEQKQAEKRLVEANLQLAEADRSKNDFLAALSHELRNPLTPVANSLYILEHAQPGGEQAERAKHVIGRQVAQLSNLVNDLLDVTRITRNKIQLRKERLELNEIVRRAVEDHRSSYDRAGVHLDLAQAPRRLPVMADATRLAQVIGNLLQNAAKFTNRGGHTRVSVSGEGGEAVVRIVDDGAGMSAETVIRLFQPFMQADQTLDRSRGGLGLGLALVKGLVELHGGTVSASSPGLGQGSEFDVRLPLDVDETLESGAAVAPATRPRRRVLIIEDNIDAADSLREALELGGHEVAVAYNGSDGLARARELQPDVLLCDIGLPGMDGYEVARAFRTEETLKRTFLVAVSGYALPEDLQLAADAGFQRHVTKPPSPRKIEELLAGLPPSTQEETAG